MCKILLVGMLCVLIIFATASCYDADEVDDISYVVMTGIDNGVNDRWKVTLQIPLMQPSGGSGENGSGAKGTPKPERMKRGKAW